MTLKHFILTRNSYPEDYPDLGQRIDIMSRYVLPGLKNQTVKNFTWVVTSPIGLSEFDLTGIDHVVLDVPPPHSFDGTTYLAQQLLSELAADLPKGELVLTTRLDNDDILLPHYVEDLQKLSRASEYPLVVDAPGYRADMRSGRVYRDTHYAPRGVPSPFISVMETVVGRRCRLRTAYYDQHSLMHRHFNITYLTRPSWVQLIHRTNKTMARSFDEVEARGELLPYQASEFLEGAIAARPIADHLW